MKLCLKKKKILGVVTKKKELDVVVTFKNFKDSFKMKILHKGSLQYG
jgi:hypothetical protein